MQSCVHYTFVIHVRGAIHFIPKLKSFHKIELMQECHCEKIENKEGMKIQKDYTTTENGS